MSYPHFELIYWSRRNFSC